MSATPSGAPLNGEPGPVVTGRAEPLRRVIDRRRIDRIWWPAYIIPEFAPKMRLKGLAVYMCLCQHAARESLTCRPGIGSMAKELGIGRSTVERALKDLVKLQLVAIEARFEASGQKTNIYILMDPPTHCEAEGAPGAQGGGAFPVTAPPCQSEGGAPSERQGGAVNLTGPSVEPGDLNQWVRCAPPTHGAPASSEEGAPAPVTRLVALWLALLVTRSGKMRRAHEEEIAAEAAELLRLGWSADQLERSLQEPDRRRTEWPREWRARLGPRAPRVAQKPPDPAEAAQRAAQAAADREAVAKARDDLIAAGGIAGLRRKVAKTVQSAEAPPPG